MTRNRRSFSTKEITLITVFSSLWAAAEIALGPIIGRLSIGPLSLHGSINRLVGWFLMVVLAEVSGRFGRVTIMTSIATLVTRTIRVSALEGAIVGLGYALGGLTFDVLFFLPLSKGLKGRLRITYLYITYVISGVSALIPYLIFKFTALGLYAFIATLPSYGWSIFKGTLLSIVGASIGTPISRKVKSLWEVKGEVEEVAEEE